MTTALLVVAHGSRRAESNDEVRALTERVRVSGGGGFADVDCAFLELAPPTIPEGLEKLIAHGAKKIIVLPYFLAAGRHVAEDIPAEVDQIRHTNPHIEIEIAPYLGTLDAMPNMLLGLLDNRQMAAEEQTE